MTATCLDCHDVVAIALSDPIATTADATAALPDTWLVFVAAVAAAAIINAAATATAALSGT